MTARNFGSAWALKICPFFVEDGMSNKKGKLPAHAISARARQIVVDLPSDVYHGIGQVVSAHAILENRVCQLLFALMKVDPKVGRASTSYRAASERFKTVKLLIDLHGLSVDAPLNDLEKQIKECCDARDQFAHGVWLKDDRGDLGLQLTRGVYETPDGVADRRFVPQARIVPTKYFSQTRQTILTTAHAVHVLTENVCTLLKIQFPELPHREG